MVVVGQQGLWGAYLGCGPWLGLQPRRVWVGRARRPGHWWGVDGKVVEVVEATRVEATEAEASKTEVKEAEAKEAAAGLGWWSGRHEDPWHATHQAAAYFEKTSPSFWFSFFGSASCVGHAPNAELKMQAAFSKLRVLTNLTLLLAVHDIEAGVDSSGTRGPSNQFAVQAQPSGIPHGYSIPESSLSSLRAEIAKYMEEAGQTDLASEPVQDLAPRRALIIAPQYPVHMDGISRLESTLQDVIKIYKMLKAYKYQPADIRILIDDLGTDVQPSCENIAVGNGHDVHRFLHFSGHGTYFENDDKSGKVAAEIKGFGTKDNSKASTTGDVERETRWKLKTHYDRTHVLDIPTPELKYYNEAIIASYGGPPKKGMHDIKQYVVFDKTLNEVMSELPKDCKLTCVFDPEDCNFKLAGAGFRGAWFSSDTVGYVEGNTPASQSLEYSGFLEGGGFPEGDNSPQTRGLVDSAVARATAIAQAIVWSACHQRQLAKDTDQYQSGLFTSVFTDRIEARKADPSMTIDALWNDVNDTIKGKAQSGKYFLQYAQVWTSLAEDEKTTKDRLGRTFAP
ncbi:hypothetical protein BDV93DRAFT_548684 [Ceratobasidium sp. AG-I]|nr:hypothetical protein BDV93DRAFT_548684 [Ceratobasidium sp. AG-I]